MTDPLINKQRNDSSWLVLGLLGAACGPVAGPGAEGGDDTTGTTGASDPTSTSDPSDPTSTTSPSDPTSPTDPTDPTDPTASTEPMPECESDLDCNSYCGYCEAGQCRESYDCCYGGVAPAVAVGWKCQPYYECYDDFQCGDDYTCVENSCQPLPVLALPPCEPQDFVASEWNLSETPGAFVLVDLDGDMDLDLAAGQPGVGQIEVALNDGKGNFVLAGAFPVGEPDTELSIVAADFDLDGDVDLAVALRGGGLVLAFGQDAVFTPAPILATSVHPQQLIATDMNGDAAPDLVVLSAGEPQVTARLNDGKGGFGPEGVAFVKDPIDPQAAVVDITADGVPDLLAPVSVGAEVGFWGGAADGVFAGKQIFTVPSGVQAVYATDLVPKGPPSVVAVRPTNAGGTATVWGPGPEQWASTPSLFSGVSGLHDGMMAEFEEPTGPDLISATLKSTIAVWASDGAGGFACERVIDVPAPTGGKVMAVGDVDGDGKADIVLGRADSGTVTVLRRP